MSGTIRGQRCIGAIEGLFVTRELHQEPPPRTPTGYFNIESLLNDLVVEYKAMTYIGPNKTGVPRPRSIEIQFSNPNIPCVIPVSSPVSSSAIPCVIPVSSPVSSSDIPCVIPVSSPVSSSDIPCVIPVSSSVSSSDIPCVILCHPLTSPVSSLVSSSDIPCVILCVIL